MRRSRNFCQGWGVQAQLSEKSSDIILVPNLLYKGDPIGYFKENYHITRFQRGRGVQLLIPMETNCSFEYSKHMFLLRNKKNCSYMLLPGGTLYCEYQDFRVLELTVMDLMLE